MSITLRRLAYLSFVPLLAAMFWGDVARAADEGIEEITVRAQKREQNLQKIGVAVTALDQAAIDRRGIEDIDEFQYYVPNFVAAGTGLAAYTLRGIGPQGPVGGAADPGFAVHVNGVYAARSAVASLDYYDLESIELLRGPQGTLYGRNSIAGSLNINTKRPTQDVEGFSDIQFGQFSHIRWRFVGNTPIIKDKLAIRVAGIFDRHDGYYETAGTGQSAEESFPVVGQDLLDENTFSIRTSLLYTPTKEITNFFTAGFGYSRGGGADTRYIGSFRNVAETQPNSIFGQVRDRDPETYARLRDNGSDLRRGNEDYPQYTRTQTWGWTNNLEYTPSNLPFVARWVTGFGFSNFTFFRDNDQSNLDLVRLFLGDRTWSISSEVNLLSDKPIVLDLGAIKPQFDWIIGGNYWHESITLNQGQGTLGTDFVRTLTRDDYVNADGVLQDPLQPGAVAGGVHLASLVDVDGQIQHDNGGVFGETSVELFGIKLTGGVRYSSITREFVQYRNNAALVAILEGANTAIIDGHAGVTAGLGLLALQAAGTTLTPDQLGLLAILTQGETVPAIQLAILQGTLAFLDPLLPGAVAARARPNEATLCAPENGRCERTWESVTWKVALQYDVPDDLIPFVDPLLYFTVSTGNRPGGYNYSPDDDFEEENVLAIEGGIKNTLWDKRIELNIGGFYYELEDAQISQVSGGIPLVTNVPEAEMYGIEVEMRAEPITGMRVNFGFGYQESEIMSSFCSTNIGVVPRSDRSLTPAGSDATRPAVLADQYRHRII